MSASEIIMSKILISLIDKSTIWIYRRRTKILILSTRYSWKIGLWRFVSIKSKYCWFTIRLLKDTTDDKRDNHMKLIGNQKITSCRVSEIESISIRHVRYPRFALDIGIYFGSFFRIIVKFICDFYVEISQMTIRAQIRFVHLTYVKLSIIVLRSLITIIVHSVTTDHEVVEVYWELMSSGLRKIDHYRNHKLLGYITPYADDWWLVRNSNTI